MKQIDQLREKSKKPGAPIINGKNSSITKDGLPKLQNKAESNPNLHKQSTIRNSRKIGRIRSTSNDDQSYKRLPSNVSSSNTSGISSAVSTASTSTKMSLKQPITTMPPINSKERRDNNFKSSLHKSSKSSNAHSIKVDQFENASVVRKKTFTITKNSTKIAEKEDNENDGKNEFSEDDAKSNVTYRVR